MLALFHRIAIFVSLVTIVLIVACVDNPFESSTSPGPGPTVWEDLGPAPTIQSLTDIVLLTPDLALSCGFGGTMLMSRDGGASWRPVPIGTSSDLHDLDFIDTQHGWVAGESGLLARTSDSGKSWSVLNINLHSTIGAIDMVSLQEGWCLGQSSEIYHTTDGGSTWELQFYSEYAVWNDLLFLNDEIGFALADNGLYVTRDGGSSWSATDPASPGDQDYFSIECADDGTLLLTTLPGFNSRTNTPYLLRSTDSGLTWQETLLPTGLVSVGQIGPSNYLACGTNGWIYESATGGQSWSMIHEPRIGGVGSMAVSGAKVIAIGGSGTIEYSSDHGQTWRDANRGRPVDFHDLHFVGPENGWASRETGLERTVDGGATWTKVDVGRYRGRALYWLDDRRGWYVDLRNDVYFTTDGGATWQEGRKAAQQNLLDMDFVDSQNGWNVGYPAAMRTRDAGVTWTVVFVPGSPMFAVDFVDTTNGWLCGAEGLIAHCSDGEFSWALQHSGTEETLFDIAFLNRNTGFCVGTHGTILRTDNGGTTWGTVPSPTSAGLLQICFVDDFRGVIVGASGTVLVTNDGGSTWRDRSTGGPTHLNAASLLDRDHLWVAGDDGALFRAKWEVFDTE